MNEVEQYGDLFVKQWSAFVQNEQLDKNQGAQFAHYMYLLGQGSQEVNLTTILEPKNIVTDHFSDSLQLGHAIDLKAVTSICDVGTGGGFPGIPLKIAFPHLKLVLVEVNHRKIRFLRRVIEELGLEQCEVSSLDWRTFLRKSNYQIDLFCARASIQPEELVRIFKPSSSYLDAQLVYWASSSWKPGDRVAQLVRREHEYLVGNKHRKLVFLGKKTV